MRRTAAPFRGAYALPGGFVRIDVSVEHAATRVLSQSCGLAGVFVEQLFTFGAVKRDPGGRFVSVAHYAVAPAEPLLPALTGRELVPARLETPEAAAPGEELSASDDGRRLRLAFDHAAIFALTVARLRGEIDYARVGFELLPAQFTLLDLLEVRWPNGRVQTLRPTGSNIAEGETLAELAIRRRHTLEEPRP
jgi:8-oxo-dGTP diphosphatase